MKYLLVIILCISFNISAKVLDAQGDNDLVPSRQTKIILEAIFQDIGIKKKIPLAPPKKKIIKVDPTPIPSPAPILTPIKKIVKKKKKMSKGESKIQALLRKNREKIKQQKEAEKDHEFRKKYYKKNNDFYADIREESERGLRDLKNENQANLKSYQDEIKKTYAHWAKMQKEFKKNVGIYKENTYNLDDKELNMESSFTSFNKQSLSQKEVKKLSTNEYTLIKNAMDLPIRNQEKRPTCASFTGIRAIETILLSNEVESDLSEQYFYWASKPQCQKFPCAKRGSWVTKGFRKSINAPVPNIPLEKNCPYQGKSISNNETQIPLKSKCNKGFVKIKSFQRLSGLKETVEALNAGKPIIAGFKLTPNFYFNNGLITYKQSNILGKTDSHAQGHAILLIGYIALPKKYHHDEGQICFITANSWGEGWGRGGYSCLTEKWVLKQKVKNAFLAVDSAISL